MDSYYRSVQNGPTAVARRTFLLDWSISTVTACYGRWYPT